MRYAGLVFAAAQDKIRSAAQKADSSLGELSREEGSRLIEADRLVRAREAEAKEKLAVADALLRSADELASSARKRLKLLKIIEVPVGRAALPPAVAPGMDPSPLLEKEVARATKFWDRMDDLTKGFKEELALLGEEEEAGELAQRVWLSLVQRKRLDGYSMDSIYKATEALRSSSPTGWDPRVARLTRMLVGLGDGGVLGSMDAAGETYYHNAALARGWRRFFGRSKYLNECSRARADYEYFAEVLGEIARAYDGLSKKWPSGVASASVDPAAVMRVTQTPPGLLPVDFRGVLPRAVPVRKLRQRYCTKCGGGISPGQTFCPKCGSQLS